MHDAGGPPPLCTDSRRLLGPSLWLGAPGATLELPLPHGHREDLTRAWGGRVAWMCAALGWRDTALTVRRHARGSTLAFTAPPDVLYAATSLSEWALQSAADELGVPYDHDALEDDRLPVDQAEALAALRKRVEAERAAPAADAVPIADRGIPVAVVTGSNGKTTTTRLIAAILRAHGHVVGLTSTDGIVIADEILERGDWSGPLGARRVLGDLRVTAAVLETARGGLLRRGLAVPRADVAVVTNIAEDHFGEFGIASLADIAEVKTTVAYALGEAGTLVLNGDDPWLDPARPDTRLSAAARALPPERILRFSHAAGWPQWLPAPPAIPITLEGVARFNCENVLAAATAARALGVPDATIGRALREFGRDPLDNAGRLMRLEVGGITLLVDYAHNPHGLTALLQTARGLHPDGRLLLVLGQAGDRDDEAIRALARVAWAARPAHVVLKDLDGYLRGRAPGEVPAILAAELRALGASDPMLSESLREHDAVRAALRAARTADLVVLPVHAIAAREAVLTLVEELRDAGWSAGAPLP